MINTSKVIRVLSLSAAAAGIILAGGSLSETKAQTRDPFAKPGWAQKRDARPGAPGSGKVAGPPVNLGAPGIEQRIDYYKRLRESAVVNGHPVPKVTSVLTLDEMAVTGIFRTPRGYAAMVEATPIKLSYTIYPGEKFFDGQLVAVEENRLVFRKVTKMTDGKFVSTVENKPLRQFTDQQVVQGTATGGPSDAVAQQPASAAPVQPGSTAKPAPVNIVSPLEEMNKQVPAAAPTKAKKDGKKPVKVARKQ
jgi:hypothetical protein